jgi:four helix bundle protein
MARIVRRARRWVGGRRHGKAAHRDETPASRRDERGGLFLVCEAADRWCSTAMVDALSGMQDYTRLLVWQRARALSVAINEATRGFPSGAAPGLRPQIMCATLSIGANIAEGAARSSRPELARFISSAAASTSEVEHHLIAAQDFGLLDDAILGRLIAMVVEVRRMLFGLRHAILSREADEQRKVRSVVREEGVGDSRLLH